MGLFVTVSITRICNDCHYAECRVSFIFMLNDIMLSVIMLSVVGLIVVMKNVVAPIVTPLEV